MTVTTGLHKVWEFETIIHFILLHFSKMNIKIYFYIYEINNVAIL